MNKKVLPIFLAFFVMGFGDVVGTLVGFAKNEFHLSGAMAGLLPFVGFAAYGVLSIPVSILQDRRGKKFTLLLGLIIVAVGLLLPTLMLSYYWWLLVAILLIGSGITVMQVSGNPLMRDVSDQGRYSRNLTFAQFIKSIGSISGPYVIPLVIALGLIWKSIFPIYFLVVIITIFLVINLKINEKKEDSLSRASFRSCFAMLKHPYILAMVLGLFLYVGAEVGMGSWIATYLKENYGFDIKTFATLGIGFFYLSLMVGRLLGSIILNWLNPKRFFIVTSIVSTLSIAGLFAGNLTLSIICIFLIGLGFANVFPLVFSIVIDEAPHKSNELSGLMIMAIVGGAIMPLLMGALADIKIMLAFLVPLISLIFITFTSFLTLKKVKREIT